MNEERAAIDQFGQWVIGEIFKQKARWIQACLANILPPELYEAAKKNREEDRLRKFFKEHGYSWREYSDGAGHGESRLYKGGILVSLFRPVVVGDSIENRQLTFYCEMNGRQVDLDGNVVVLTA